MATLSKSSFFALGSICAVLPISEKKYAVRTQASPLSQGPPELSHSCRRTVSPTSDFIVLLFSIRVLCVCIIVVISLFPVFPPLCTRKIRRKMTRDVERNWQNSVRESSHFQRVSWTSICAALCRLLDLLVLCSSSSVNYFALWDWLPLPRVPGANHVRRELVLAQRLRIAVLIVPLAWG